MFSRELSVSKGTRQNVKNSAFFQMNIKMFLFFVFFLFGERRTIQDSSPQFKILQARHDYGHSLEETATLLRSWNAHFTDCASKFRRDDKNCEEMRRHGKMFDVPNTLSQLAKFTYIIAGCTLKKKWNKEILIFLIYINMSKGN